MSDDLWPTLDADLDEVAGWCPRCGQDADAVVEVMQFGRVDPIRRIHRHDGCPADRHPGR